MGAFFQRPTQRRNSSPALGQRRWILGPLVLLCPATRALVTANLVKLRRRFLLAMLESLEALTGEQVAGVVTVRDDETLQLWRWQLDELQGAQVDLLVGEARWNASKSL